MNDDIVSITKKKKGEGVKFWKIKAGELGYVSRFDLMGIEFSTNQGVAFSDKMVAERSSARLNKFYDGVITFTVEEIN